MRVRRENIDQTRLRITEATMQLHERIGPAATTVSAIAAEAGVTRLTVYRHFPDEAALVGACAGHWNALHPRPDAARWVKIRDPAARLGTALSETYTWAETAAPMMDMIYRDLHTMPTFVSEFLVHDEQSRVAILATGFGARSRTAVRLKGALRHALHIRTWASLCIDGALTNDEAAELMIGAVMAAVRRDI